MDSIQFSSLSLERYCKLFNITANACSCDDEDIRKGFKTVCQSNADRRRIVEITSASLVYAAIVCLASICGLIGNSLVLAVAWKNRRGYLVCQKLISILAISDFGFALVQLIVSIPNFWTDKWLYGTVMCKIFFSASQLGAIIAIGFIVIISLERFIGVIKPMLESSKIIIVLCVINGVIGLLSVIPLLISSSIDVDGFCLESWSTLRTKTIYDLYLLLVVCMLPSFMILLFYFIIVWKLRRGLQDKHLQESMDKTFFKKRVKESHRVVKIVLALTVAFIVFVFPSRVITLIFDLTKLSNKTYEVLSVVQMVTYPFHVAINPLLYSVIDVRWRNEISRLFKCKVGRKLSTSSGVTGHSSVNHRRMTRLDTDVTLYQEYERQNDVNLKFSLEKITPTL